MFLLWLLAVILVIAGIVCSVATAICITWGTLQVMGGRKPEWEPMLRRLQAPSFGMLLLRPPR